jgi:hypothetical protein
MSERRPQSVARGGRSLAIGSVSRARAPRSTGLSPSCRGSPPQRTPREHPRQPQLEVSGGEGRVAPQPLSLKM